MTRARGTTSKSRIDGDRTAIGRRDPSRGALPFAAITCGVAITVLAVYWPVLSAGAVSLDDTKYLFENHVLQHPGWASTRKVLGEILSSSTVAGYYEPLTLISLMADVALGGRPDNLKPFHRTSLALHVLNSTLVIVLLYLLFGAARGTLRSPDSRTTNTDPVPSASPYRWIWAAATAGLLFGLHPLTVEPVAWVWERKTTLAAFFGLACLIAYVLNVRRPSLILYGTCLIAYLLALMSKPTVTPLPVLMLLLDYWPLQRLRMRAVWEKGPFFAIAAASAFVTVVSTQRNAEVVFPGAHSLLQVPLRACYLFMFYLYKVLWPTRLSSFYLLPEPLVWTQPLVLAGVLGTCVLVGLGLVSLRWTRAFVTGGLFFVVAISPTLGLIGYSWVSASDKYVYVPGIGLLLIVAWLLGRLWDAAAAGSRRTPGAAMAAVVLLVAGAESHVTRAYLAKWRDTERLYQYMLTLTPDAAPVHANLGIVLAREGRTADAEQHLLKALRLKPEDPDALTSLGNILSARGELDAALARHTEALRRAPACVEAHINLGIVLGRKGRLDDAISQFAEALRLTPESAVAHGNIALAMMRSGRIGEGVAHFERAIELDPNAADWCVYLADALAKQGRSRRAIECYRQALTLRPDSAGVLNNLAWVLATQGGSPDATEAIQLARRACELTGYQDPGALDTLAAAYAAAGRFPEAIETLRKGIDLAASGGKQNLPTGMRTRLELYEAGNPYRESPPTSTRPGA
jgi:tetratricopeptide (TPR) repeat protein